MQLQNQKGPGIYQVQKHSYMERVNINNKTMASSQRKLILFFIPKLEVEGPKFTWLALNLPHKYLATLHQTRFSNHTNIL